MNEDDRHDVLRQVEAIANMSPGHRELAEVLSEVDDALREAWLDDDVDEVVFRDCLALAMVTVDPDARYTDYDVMGHRQYNEDGWRDHLTEICEEVLPEQSVFTCPECKMPTTITVQAEARVKFNAKGEDNYLDASLETYPESHAVCDKCGYEHEMRSFTS